MLALIHSPYLWVLLFALYIIFMAAVDSMDAPTAQDSRRYRWWYRFLHIVAVNTSRAAGAKFPVLKTVEPETAETTAQIPNSANSAAS